MGNRVIKMLHEIGSAGVIGTYVACLVLALAGPAQPPLAHAAVLRSAHALVQWLLVPSLGLVLASGLLALAFNNAYHNAGWAWVKALLGISLFEGTLLTVAASARQAAALGERIAAGAGDAAQLAPLLRTEQGGLWVLLAVALANVVLGVWRPRMHRSRLP